MLSTKKKKFIKGMACPSSQEILAFQKGEISDIKHRFVESHSKICDFCGAEIRFYENFPLKTEEIVRFTEIPRPLYELADALLSNKQNCISILNRLINKSKRVKV